MKKWLKWIGITVISLILILIIAGYLLTLLIKPADLKPLLSKQIYNATGQQVEFRGNIHWTLFPTLSLQIDDAIIKNPETFGDQPLATIKTLSVGIKLFPLLSHKIETTNLALRDVTLNLINNKQGKTNWETKQLSVPKTATPSQQPAPSNQTKKTAISLNIPTVDFKNMTLNWDNQKNGQKLTVSDLNVAAKNIQHNKPFPASISFQIDNNKPDAHGTIAANAMLTLNQDGTYLLKQLVLNTNLKGKGLPQGRLKTTIKGDGVFTSKSASMKPLFVNINGNKLTGYFNLQDFTNFPLDFKFNINPFIAGKLSGSATASGNLTLATPTTAPSTQSTNGTFVIDVHHGAYNGINAYNLIQTALALANKKMPSNLESSNKTTFNDLHASFNIKNGVAKTNDFRVASKVIFAKGGGTIDLNRQTIYISLSISSAMSNNAYTQNIPATISGPLSKPTATIDKAAILKKVLQNQLQKQLNKSIKGLNINLF